MLFALQKALALIALCVSSFPEHGLDLFHFALIEAVEDPPIPAVAFVYKRLGCQLGQGRFHFGQRIHDSLFQQPPFHDSFHCVLCLWMPHQILEDLVTERSFGQAHRLFHKFNELYASCVPMQKRRICGDSEDEVGLGAVDLPQLTYRFSNAIGKNPCQIGVFQGAAFLPHQNQRLPQYEYVDKFADRFRAENPGRRAFLCE